jgi:hypothetical protein
MSQSARNGNTNRMDCVFIRKSSKGQDEGGQIANVETMLKARGVYVPEAHWFIGTVSRRKVKANADFIRLLEKVEGDQVGTVYIESQDRWGTKDRPELFSLLGLLRDHTTRLFDLKAGKDLTERDLATEMLAFVNSVKSEKELQDLAYRSLRSRVGNFKETGSWPTGSHPYGYGKACYSPDGQLKWVWQPVNRSRGQIFYPDPAGGELIPGPVQDKITRKDRRDVIKLVPSSNPDYIRAVKLVFELYTRVGLSRRQISARLNAEGLLFNGGPFTHPDVTNILENPVYMGDTHFGKVQTAELHTFDASGLITEVKGKHEIKRRPASECLVRKATHDALIDRKTWELAQQKLQAERERTSYSPRNPAYYLRQLFVCGHCGKGMAGRTEIDKNTGARTVMYVCSTYVAGRCNGHPVPCGYQRITHEDAERLLLDKIVELDLPFDETASAGARANLEARLARLGHEDEESEKQWQRWMHEGIQALIGHLAEEYGLDWGPEFRRMQKAACRFYWGHLDGEPDDYRPGGGVVGSLADLKRAVQEIEAAGVGEAQRKLGELREEHRAFTLKWVKATDAMQAVLKQEIERLEAEIREWEPRTVPLSGRLKALYAAEAERKAEREKLQAEWPSLDNREKGEAMRRLFTTVTLFWEKHHHPPLANPPRTRPRKTNRQGRNSYTLQRDRIKWGFAVSDLGNFS